MSLLSGGGDKKRRGTDLECAQSFTVAWKRRECRIQQRLKKEEENNPSSSYKLLCCSNTDSLHMWNVLLVWDPQPSLQPEKAWERVVKRKWWINWRRCGHKSAKNMDEMREVQKACDGRLKRQKCKPHAANIICCFKFNVYHAAQLEDHIINVGSGRL